MSARTIDPSYIVAIERFIAPSCFCCWRFIAGVWWFCAQPDCKKHGLVLEMSEHTEGLGSSLTYAN